MSTKKPAKMDILRAIIECQNLSSQLLIESDKYEKLGQIDASLTTREQLINILQRQMGLEELNNQYFPESPFQVSLTVNCLLDALLTQADLIEANGEIRLAEEIREKAGQLKNKYLSPLDQAKNNLQLASSLIKQGRFNEALVILDSARDTFLKNDDVLDQARVTGDIAGILEWLGDYDRALVKIKETSCIIEPLLSGRELSESAISSSIRKGILEDARQIAALRYVYLENKQTEARLNTGKGNFDEAKSQFMAILPQIPDSVRVGIEFHLGKIAILQGHNAEGLTRLIRLEPLFSGLARSKLGVLLSWKAEACLGLNRSAEALENIQQAIQELVKYHDADSLWKAQWRLARILTALHQSAEALKAYTQAAEVINTLRKAPLGYRLDSLFLRDKIPVFESGIRLACDLNQAETCCRLIEMVKSRSLTTTLSTVGLPTGREDEKPDTRFDDISRRLDALEYASFTSEETPETKKQREELLAARADLIERARYSDPRWRLLTSPVPFELNKLLDLLDQRKQAALTLFYQPGQVVAVLMKDKKCSVSRLPISPGTADALTRYQDNLYEDAFEAKLFDPSTSLKLKADDLIPAGMMESALQSSSLVIAPHGSLHLLPWAGLIFKGKRLFQYCPVSIIPNLNCLSSLETEFSSRPKAGIIGYSSVPGHQPLELVTEVLQVIKETYSAEGGIIGDVIKGINATENNFWQLATHPDSPGNVLHIASHGNFKTDDPMNSGLLLADGKADASEISRAKIHYDEVILSACCTGLRPIEVRGIPLPGDDLLGLPGAFLEAGVRSVLVSIPPARQDASLSFMTIYHENRATGKTPLRALQETQKTMVSENRYEPCFWIGMTIYGGQ